MGEQSSGGLGQYIVVRLPRPDQRALHGQHSIQRVADSLIAVQADLLATDHAGVLLAQEQLHGLRVEHDRGARHHQQAVRHERPGRYSALVIASNAIDH